jgi:hypothetical protein
VGVGTTTTTTSIMFMFFWPKLGAMSKPRAFRQRLGPAPACVIDLTRSPDASVVAIHGSESEPECPETQSQTENETQTQIEPQTQTQIESLSQT